MQWFRGEIEASYLGTPNAQPYFAKRPAGTHYQVRIYRAALRNLSRIEPPVAEGTEGAPAPSRGESFAQARVDDALIAGVRGPGSSYQGPIFALEIQEPRFSHPVHKDGRAYGRLTGTALFYCELPPEPAQPSVETTLRALPAHEGVSEPTVLPAELRSAPEAVSNGEKPASERAAIAEADTDALPNTAIPEPPLRVRTPREESALPLFALTAAVALGLWVSCGPQPALLWCLFMLPTLTARKLFQGIFNDSPGIRGFGALLSIAQLVCASTLVSEWWSMPCKELHVLPLIGIVAVIFPAGILPSVLPLAFNASGLALVLSVWCGGDNGACAEARPKAGAHAPASVEHPGVPRTNDDGSWPRRPPGK